MDNQHRHIKGYRELSAVEIAVMNEGKELAVQIGAYIAKLEAIESTDKRWISIGKTHAQEAFMALTRSIAKSTTF